VTAVDPKLAGEMKQKQFSEAMGGGADRNPELHHFLLRHAKIIL
jgi:hypothetical protein